MIIILLVNIICLSATSQGHSFFQLVPELGGLQRQSEGRIVSTDSSGIYLMGELTDVTTVPGDTVIRAFISKFDYHGNMIYHRIMYDSAAVYGGEFRLNTRPVYHRRGTIFGLFDRVSLEKYSVSSLVEIDKGSGEITQYRTYVDPPVSQHPQFGGGHYGGFLFRDDGDNFYSYQLGFDYDFSFRKYDSLFTITDDVHIVYNHRINFPKYIVPITDTTLAIIGTSYLQKDPVDLIGYPFYMEVNYNGEVLFQSNA